MVITRNKTFTKREQGAKQAVLQKCCLELEDAAQCNSGRKPYGIVSGMVCDLKFLCILMKIE